MLGLILAEAALEFVPEALWAHPAVAKHANRVGVAPRELFLDRSYHHAAMRRLPEARKRGRPDLVHFALLAATDTPLFELDGLTVYLHTCQNRIVEFSPGVRLPRSYFRFEGLMRQALYRGERANGTGELLRVRPGDASSVIATIRPERVIGLSTLGKPSSAEDVAGRLVAQERSVVVVGAFPHGHFSEPIRKVCDQLLRIHPLSLEAHVVVARVLYEVEQRLGPFRKPGARKAPLDVT